MNVLALQELVDGKPSKDHFFSPFSPKTPSPPLTLATYATDTKTLLTRKGLLATSTVELFKGNATTYRYQLSNFSTFLLQPDFVKVLKDRCPSKHLYYNILDSRQATRKSGPGHFSTNRSHYRLFAKNGRAVVAVEVRWKVRTSGDISFYHYVWVDASMVDVDSLREEFRKENFVEAKKRRGLPVPKAVTGKVEKWMENLPEKVREHIARLASHSPEQNPFITSPPSDPVSNSDVVKSSTSCPPSTSLRSNLTLSTTRNPSKTTIYHDFHRRVINDFSLNFELDTSIRGGTVLKNADGEDVQVETVFGISQSLEKLGESLELSTGGLISAKEFGTVHVALPRGAASKYRTIHHRTLPYQAVLIVQDYL